MHFDPGKGESTAVGKKQPHTEQKTPERQGCQILGKGESNGTTLGNSKQVGPTNNSLIQFPSDHHHLLRKNGYKFGWPTWPKIRFKCHSKNRWKSRFRALSQCSIRFAPCTGTCKLSRGAFRVRMLNRRGTIRFRTQPRPSNAPPQMLMRSSKAKIKHPLSNGTFRVRTLNRSGSTQFGSSMHHLQTHPVQIHVQRGKPAIHECERIQAVILYPHQFDGWQITAKCREEMLRNNYDQVVKVISHELSSALHSIGAQNQTQSHVAGTHESDEAGGLVNGQQPQPV